MEIRSLFKSSSIVTLLRRRFPSRHKCLIFFVIVLILVSLFRLAPIGSIIVVRDDDVAVDIQQHIQQQTTFLPLVTSKLSDDEIYINNIVTRAFRLWRDKNTKINLEQQQQQQQELDDSRRVIVESFRKKNKRERCALNFHGLPRAFRTRVLPSIVRDILIPNAIYNCDVFVYYHYLLQEDSGRSGGGGVVEPDAVELLRLAVHRVAQEFHGTQKRPIDDRQRQQLVLIQNFTNEEFTSARGEILDLIRTKLDDKGRSIYVPYAAGFTMETTFNVVRMWHVIHGAFELMERTAKKLGVRYFRVGVFRDDVIYTTPIDIFQYPVEAEQPQNRTIDHTNKVAVIPGFARYPVNDRMFYGPYDAVKVYATKRFDLLDGHVNKKMGGERNLHPETFLKQAILPIIENTNGVRVVGDATICFVRVRADESFWVNDCDNKYRLPGGPILNETIHHIEQTLDRKCQKSPKRRKNILPSVVEAMCE